MSDVTKTPAPKTTAPKTSVAKAPATNTPAAPKATAPRVSPYAGFTPLSPSDEKLWSALIQLSGLVSYFVGPWVGYLLLRQRGPFVREHSVSALNWQLSVLVYMFVSWILMIAFIGFFLLIAVAILNVVFSILAAQHAHRGQLYNYPLSIKFLRA